MTTFDLQHAAMAILDATAAEKHVLLILALRADKSTAQCRPGIARMVKDTGLSERTVQRAIVALEAAGHLTRDERHGVGVVYTVHPRHGVTPDTVTPPSECRETPVTVAPKLPRTTSSSSKTTSSQKKRVRAPAFELPDWVPADAWEGWLEMRRTKGAKETTRALSLAIGELRKLADAGHPPGGVLDQSTLRRWTGLFPIKDTSNGLPQRSNHPAAQHGARGPRPDPALDMLHAARAAEEAERAAGDWQADCGAGLALPSYRRN